MVLSNIPLICSENNPTTASVIVPALATISTPLAIASCTSGDIISVPNACVSKSLKKLVNSFTPDCNGSLTWSKKLVAIENSRSPPLPSLLVTSDTISLVDFTKLVFILSSVRAVDV